MKDEINKKYNLYEVVKALRRRIYFVHPRSSFAAQVLRLPHAYEQEADFEDVICEYVDAINLIKKIRNKRKRDILFLKAKDFNNVQIAISLGISEQAVGQNLKWIEKFLIKIQE